VSLQLTPYLPNGHSTKKLNCYTIVLYNILRTYTNNYYPGITFLIDCLTNRPRIFHSYGCFAFFIVLALRGRHHCWWRAAKFSPMFGAQGPWAGRDLYRATLVDTRRRVFRSHPKDSPHLVASYDTQGNAEDLFLPGRVQCLKYLAWSWNSKRLYRHRIHFDVCNSSDSIYKENRICND
jgi:hypothetical protein